MACDTEYDTDNRNDRIMNPPNNYNQPISPEDDAMLQAIEALEAQTVDPDPKPLVPETPVTPAPVVVTPAPEPIPTPVITPAPVPTPLTVIEPTPVTTEAPTAPITPEPATAPTDPSSAIAAALARGPETTTPKSTYQPFPKKKLGKKPLLIILAIILVAGLGVGGYFGWQYLQSQKTSPIVNGIDTSVPDEDPGLPADSEASVNSTASDIENQVNSVDETEYKDETLSDAALYE